VLVCLQEEQKPLQELPQPRAASPLIGPSEVEVGAVVWRALAPRESMAALPLIQGKASLDMHAGSSHPRADRQ